MAEDELFHAQQNARVATNAEEYYRSMFHSEASSWNLRDQHMMETLASWCSTWRANGPDERWWCGRTTLTLGTPVPPR